MVTLTFACPSDGSEMEADHHEVKAHHLTTHTCTECGYSEVR